MQTFDPVFHQALVDAPEKGIRPARFFWVYARNRSTGAEIPVGFWTGQYDISTTLQAPGNSNPQTRTFFGKSGLKVDILFARIGLESRPLNVNLDYNSPNVQTLIRTYTIRHAYCEVYTGLMEGAVLIAPPQIDFVGRVDQAPETRPKAGSTGSLQLRLRDDLLTQLASVNPAKSSDAHQRQRLSTDTFSRYSGVIKSRQIDWWVEK